MDLSSQLTVGWVITVVAVFAAGPWFFEWPLFRTRARCPRKGAESDHVFQPELAEPNGNRGRRLSREPRGRRRVGFPRLHGTAVCARVVVESGIV